MVAIVAGSGLGLFNTSLNSLGGIGQPGSGKLGQTQGSGYVNMATGNLVLQVLDEQRSGRGGDLYHLRSYNSLGQLNDADADGWRWDGERKLVLSGTVNTVGSTVTRITGDGHETVYGWDADSSRYVSPEGSGAHDSLAWNSGTSEWSWTDGSSRTVEVYTGSTGRLKTVTDTTGNIISYGYDANGRLNSVKDNSSGQELVMVYDANGRLQRLDTRATSGGALTRQVYYAYDASGRLTSVTADLTPTDNSITDSNVYTTSYTYDSTSFRIASITQSDGTTAAFTYVLVGSEYRIQTVTDINGVTTFAYDTTNRRTDVTNGLGQQWTYTYDTNNQLVEVKTPAVNGQRLTTSYSYDAQGNVTQVADGRGNVIAYQYDVNGNQILERDAVGNTVKRTYDANNQLQNEVHYTVPAAYDSGTATWTDPPAANALTTRYVYDSSSRLRFAISAEGSVTEYRYGTNGLRSKEIHFSGAVYDLSSLLPTDILTESQITTWSVGQAVNKTELTDYTYDTLGNLNKTTVYYSSSAVGTGTLSGSAIVTEYVYDAYGRLLQTIAVRGSSRNVRTTLTSAVYDGIGRVQSEASANGTTTTIYDGVNHQIRVTNTAGLTTTQTYDAQGHLSSVLQAAANETSRSTSYVYDAAGRLTMTQDPSGVRSYIFYDEADRVSARIDGTGAVVEYVYNANGQVTSEIRYATLVDTTSWYNGTSVTKTLVSQIRPSTTANDRSTQYSYDNANRLAMSVNPGGIATVYTYDGNDRLLQTQTMDRVTRFFYDKDGHHVGLLDAEGYLTENVYNSAGHLVNVRRYAPLTSAALRATGTLADLRPSITGRLDTWNFYDPAGRLIGVLDDKQFLTQYTYDEANNQRKEIRYGPAYTSTVTTATPFSTVQGAVAATGNFSTTVTDYDGMGRVLKVTNKEGTITQNEYDAAGRLVRSTVADATAEARTTRLRYNAFGELTGKITGEDADLVTVGMTGAQIADIFAQHGLRYVYDVSGRQARVTDTAGNTSVYFYDAANRLTTVINGAGEVREMVYNTFGEQSEAASLSNRLSSSDRGDLASNGGGLLTQQVKDLVAAIRDVSKDSRTQYSYNMRGLLASKTDAEGYVSSYGYTSFGELDTETRTLSLSPSSTVATKYTYNKRSELLSTTIDATGLNIVRSQTYDAFGRLLTQTDATGMVTSTAYSNAGRIIAV